MELHDGSYNHYSYGAVYHFMFAHVAGIKPNREFSGKYASASFESPYGKIKSSWNRESDEKTKFEILVPSNTSATVKLPNGEYHECLSGHYRFDCSAAISRGYLLASKEALKRLR